MENFKLKICNLTKPTSKIFHDGILIITCVLFIMVFLIMMGLISQYEYLNNEPKNTVPENMITNPNVIKYKNKSKRNNKGKSKCNNNRMDNFLFGGCDGFIALTTIAGLAFLLLLFTFINNKYCPK